MSKEENNFTNLVISIHFVISMVLVKSKYDSDMICPRSVALCETNSEDIRC